MCFIELATPSNLTIRQDSHHFSGCLDEAAMCAIETGEMFIVQCSIVI